MENNIRKELESLAEEKYRLFSSSLIPNIDNVLGVRLPVLRKIAKRLAKTDYEMYLSNGNLIYFEEVMLQGMIIGYLESAWIDKERFISQFIPRINNWSVCDSFCSGLKFRESEKDAVWKFVRSYLQSEKTYDIRFAVVMLLFYFPEEKYAKQTFKAFDKIRHEDYYVRMSVAWAVSIYYRELPEMTMTYLHHNKLDDWTYNKALQKITESLTIDAETKKLIRSMKRKTKKV